MSKQNWILSVIAGVMLLGCIVTGQVGMACAQDDSAVSPAATSQVHGRVKMYYTQPLADADSSNSSFTVDEVKLWVDSEFPRGVSSRVALQVDSEGSVYFREAFLSQGTDIYGKAGIFENQFGTSTYYGDYGIPRWIGPSESYARLGLPIPVSDLGIGGGVNIDWFSADATIYNGSGYKNVRDLSNSKDIVVDLRFTPCSYFDFGAGMYKSLEDEEVEGFTYNSLYARVGNQRDFALTGEYLGRQDIFDVDVDQPEDHAWIFTGDYTIQETVGLIGRVEMEDGASDFSFGENVSISSFDRVTVGVNFYPAGIEEGVAIQAHLSTTDPGAENLEKVTDLKTQLAWRF